MFNIFNGHFLFIKETYGYSCFLWLNVLTAENFNGHFAISVKILLNLSKTDAEIFHGHSALFNEKKKDGKFRGRFIRSLETRALFGTFDEQLTIKQEMLKKFSCLGHFRARIELPRRFVKKVSTIMRKTYKKTDNFKTNSCNF